MELQNCAAAWALEDGCRTLGISNEAAPELLKFLICKSKHEQLQGLPGQHMFPSSKLAALLQWACDNPLVSEVVYELVGGPVEAVATGRSQDGLSDTDTNVVMQQLYALNVLAQDRYTPSLALWQEPDAPLIVTAAGAGPVAFTSPALSGQQQQQQLAADIQAYRHAEAAQQQGSPEAPEPYGLPWKIAVNMAATSYKPATTYAVQAVQGLTVHEFKKELLRQSMSASSPMELRVFDGAKELYDSYVVPHVAGLRVMLPGQLFR